MSTKMEDDIKRWTTKRKSALMSDIIQGKTTVAEGIRQGLQADGIAVSIGRVGMAGRRWRW